MVEYVIDGTQRLLTLHRCLTPRRNGIDERFQVGFDLDRERFVSLSFDDLPEAYVNLSSVLSPGIYDEIQSNASRARFGDLVRAVSELHRRIIGYEVPVMSIQGTGTNDVITVFESLNQKGVRLSKADLRRAEAARITVPE